MFKWRHQIQEPRLCGPALTDGSTDRFSAGARGSVSWRCREIPRNRPRPDPRSGYLRGVLTLHRAYFTCRQAEGGGKRISRQRSPRAERMPYMPAAWECTADRDFMKLEAVVQRGVVGDVYARCLGAYSG
ncbi:hypothetical protein NDU88_008220 [Pleurodeles waltl]|uniref:Uncharacterized protein n=1 Tax=Pleurodeles waltl TaxID=8319 RepID=A0AAV7N6K4_PLEWA|nr:hypothetical protein NDU88_008220 [Pleurodeles waltl]